MRCLVAVKRVIDPYVKVRVNTDKTAVIDTNVKMAMNPFDEIAVEAAVKLREEGLVDEVVAVSIGSSEEILRQALARGADKSILVKTESSLEPRCIAKILKHVVQQNDIQLALLGKQAIDDDSNQVGQRLAALLNWSQGSFASDIKIDDGKVLVTREVDSGLDQVELNLPAVITTDLRLNEPRYISLPNVMHAKRKPLDVIELSDIEGDFSNQLEILTIDEPSQRNAGEILPDVATLVAKLKQHKVI